MMAVVGILVAAAIIVGVSALNLPPGVSTSTSTVVSRVTTATTSVSTSIETTIKISNSTTPEGTMAVQIADLLNLPAGVSHIYLQYSDIEVHTVIGNASIWLRVASGKTIDLITLSNRGMTVAMTSIPSSSYDSVRFTLNSATVTFEGNNVTAFVPQTEVSVPIGKGGISVATNGTSGLLFDIAPSVVPLSAGNATQLEIIPYAKALSIPSSVPVSLYGAIGSTLDLSSQSWYTSTQVNLAKNLTVLTALVTNNAFLVVLKNTGNATVTINGLSILEPAGEGSNLQTIVTTITTVTTITVYNQNASAKSPAPHDIDGARSYNRQTSVSVSNSLLSPYQTVATFFVLYNGQVLQPSTGVNAQQLGLVLQPGQNASLTFVGKIQTLNGLVSPYAPLQIIPGSPYILEVQGPFGQSEEISISAISPF